MHLPALVVESVEGWIGAFAVLGNVEPHALVVLAHVQVTKEPHDPQADECANNGKRDGHEYGRRLREKQARLAADETVPA